MRAGLENNRYDQQRSAASLQNKVDPVQRSSALVDNRPETAVVQQLKKMANNSGRNDSTAQLQAGTNSTAASQTNKTGLPAQLKSGIESLSGQSMDDVNVHYNSDKPAQLKAHAFAQGTDIHLAAGQEKHLPHEAWHVVQQKQGRVQPTTQLKGKVNINDDPSLEREADVMGARALSAEVQSESISSGVAGQSTQLKTVQRAPTPDAGKADESTKSFEATVEQDMLILRGDRSWWGRLTGSQFTKLYNAIETLGTATQDDKPALIEVIHTLGQTYLDTHVDSDENDKIRRASIERIVAGIARFKSDSEAAAKALSIASTDDKVGIGAKLKKAIFGTDTPFVQAVNAFTEYQNQSSSLKTTESSEGIAFLRGVFEKAKAVKSKVDAWKELHPSSEERTDDLSDKRGIIQNMVDKLGVINVGLKFKYKNLFKFTGEQVKIDPLKEELSIDSIKLKLLDDAPTQLQNLEGEAKSVTYKDREFDFKELSLTKPPEEFSPFPGIKLTSPPSVVLKKSGAEYELHIGESGIDVKAGNLFKGNAKASGVFKYSSGTANNLKLVDQINIATISVTLLEDVPSPIKDLTATATGVKIKAAGDSYDVDFSKISVTGAPTEFTPINGLKFTSPSSVDLTKRGPGKYTLEIGASSVNVVAGGWFSASATASGKFDYDSGAAGILKSTVNIPTATAAIGDSAPDFLKGISGTAENLVIRSGFDPEGDIKNGVDWEKITVTSPTYQPSFGDYITVNVPNKAEILGPNKHYETTFIGSEASAKVGDTIEASGKADFYLDTEGNKGIKKANLKVDVMSPVIPGELKPFWPLNFGMQMLFPPTPLNANLELEVGGGAQAKIAGDIVYPGKAGDNIDFSVGAELIGKVHASIKVGAGVGHSWIVYAGVFAKAMAEAVAKGTATMKGCFVKADGSYGLDSAHLDYGLKATLTASISAGAEAKALGFFNKTLYEVKAAEWKIGETERKGSYDLKKKKEEDATGSGFLAGKIDGVPDNIPADANDTVKSIAKSGSDEEKISELIGMINQKVLEPAKYSGKPIDEVLVGLRDHVANLDGRIDKLMPFSARLYETDKSKALKNAKSLVAEILGFQIPSISLSFQSAKAPSTEDEGWDMSDSSTGDIEGAIQNLDAKFQEIAKVLSTYK